MKKMFCVKILFFLSITLIVSTQAFPEDVLIKSNWRSLPLNIDGSPGDWADVTLSSAEKIDVDYAFMNDAENLFVIFEFTDKKDMSSINYTGLTMWINTEGKKKKDYGITFLKKKVTADFYLDYLEKQGQKVTEEEKQKIQSMSSIIYYDAAVTNKKSKSTSSPPEDLEIKPAIFRSGLQKGLMLYELSIPLARATDMAPGISTQPGQTIKVCFEWGGMTDELRKQMRDKQVGSGRATGVADANPQSGIGVPQQSRSPKKYSVWVDIQLAENNEQN